MSLTEKLIINAAITGIVPTRQDNPHVPLTPSEIAQDARRCREAGASIIHLHARQPDGAAAWQREIYEEILGRVREACPDIILCVSTSGRVFKSFEQRAAVLDAANPAPEMASLTLGSMNFAREPSVNSPEMITALALRMRERQILPELECFEIGMAEYAHYLLKHGILKPPCYFNLLLGSLGTLGATPENLAAMVRALPPSSIWAAAGIGRFQFQVNALAIAIGGHVRVGLEDNLWFDADRQTPASNPALIERLARLAAATGRPLATPQETRALLNLQPPASSPS